MNSKTRKIILASLLASLTCVATMLIKIPTFQGYLNLGDGFVLLSAWLLSPVYSFLSAGIGSALADVFSGYLIYAPATFLIKGLMAVLAFYGFSFLRKKTSPLAARMVSGCLSEILMVTGYYIFEGFLYGFVPSLVNIPTNAMQGIAGLILGVLLIKVFEKNHILK